MSEASSADTPSLSPTRRLAACLNESVMGFFALVAFAVALGPLVFDLSPVADHALQAVEWIVVGAFALEFAVQFVAAEDRHAWVRSGWRILDVITIVGPVVALLPGISDIAGGSLALRLLRVGRAVAFGTKAGSAATRRRHGPGQTTMTLSPKVTFISDPSTLQTTGSDWATCLEWARQPGPGWFHVTQISADHLRQAAHIAGVEIPNVDEDFEPDAPFRLRSTPTSSTLFVWLPAVSTGHFPKVTRLRVAALLTERGVLTATPDSFDLPASIHRLAARMTLPSQPFPIRIGLAILALARERFQFTAQRFEQKIRFFDSIPTTDGGRLFLEETFHLRREISATALDLGQLRAIIRSLANGPATLRGVDLSTETFLDQLLIDTDGTHEHINTLKEDLKSVIELHINLKGFEMNKFLKLLAIASFLGLIPSVAGGLLGMNVAGNPWPITLSQVAFCVGMAAATALYVFAIKGWLR